MSFKSVFSWSIIGIVLIAIAYHYIQLFLQPDIPIEVQGFVDPAFKKIKEVLESNLKNDNGYAGAAIAVYYKGKKVADLWGGYADYRTQLLWKKNTISMLFSCGKGIAALCLAKLVDKGILDYDALVTEYWPEFGQNGKSNVTVKMLLSHQAGLIILPAHIPIFSDETATKKKILESATPNWAAGTKVGYHTASFGFYAEQLLNLVDPQKRTMAQFFQEEIAKPFGIDYYFGVPYDQFYRVARLSDRTTLFSMIKNLFNSETREVTLSLFNPNSYALHGITSIFKINTSIVEFFNNYDVQHVEISCCAGIGSVGSVAKLFNYLLTGEKVNGVELLSRKTFHRLLKPVISGWDETLKMETVGGHGFFFFPNPKKERTIFGHHGLGGQIAALDQKHQLAFSIVTNYISNDFQGRDPRYLKLRDAIYESIGVI